MAARSKSASDEIARLEGMIANLEKRLERAGGDARSDVEADVSNFVSEALSNVMERVRESADIATDELAERATKAGTDAFKKLTAEAESHPLMLVAVAAAIGFLLGMSRR